MIKVEFIKSKKDHLDKKILCDGCIKMVSEDITEVYMGFKDLGYEENRVKSFALCKYCLGEFLIELEKSKMED